MVDEHDHAELLITRWSYDGVLAVSASGDLLVEQVEQSNLAPNRGQN